MKLPFQTQSLHISNRIQSRPRSLEMSSSLPPQSRSDKSCWWISFRFIVVCFISLPSTCKGRPKAYAPGKARSWHNISRTWARTHKLPERAPKPHYGTRQNQNKHTPVPVHEAWADEASPFSLSRVYIIRASPFYGTLCFYVLCRWRWGTCAKLLWCLFSFFFFHARWRLRLWSTHKRGVRARRLVGSSTSS